jgi:ABC-type uncharacterized transport system ATPase subunit
MERPLPDEPPDAAARLQVRDVTKQFGGVRAVDGVSFEIGDGQVVGLIGANGAGKTTLLHLLYGRHRADAGTVVLAGRDVTRLPPRAHARLGMGLVFQNTSVFLGLSVEENLLLGAMPKQGRGRPADRLSAVEQMLEVVDLVDQRYVPAASLAHGQQQWLEIGMALLAGPDLLLLDEPTSGMTRAESRRTAELVRRLQTDHPRRAVVVVEHNLEFIRMISDRVMVMHRGCLIADGSIAEVQADPAVQDSYLGRHA